jgi:DNA-binding GntR family transcriptional regulator
MGQTDQQYATLATSVYVRLRSDVLGGRLKPGEKLATGRLSVELNSGSTPIREALNRLLAEGLVVLEEHKGFSVAPASEAELQDLVAARRWIDGLAVRRSIANHFLEWEEALLLACHRLSRAAAPADTLGDDAAWKRLHRGFHMALVSGTGSRWMARASEQLFDASERYRLLVMDCVSEEDERRDHEAIVAACLERRPDEAVALIDRHYQRMYDVYVDAVAKMQ